MSDAVIVVDTTAAQQTQSLDNSLLAFRSVLPDSAYSGDDSDPTYPFDNCLDFRDNTKYSPSISSGSVTITFTQSQLNTINYFAFAIHNSQEAGLTGTFEVDSGAGYEVVSEFVNLPNNKPFISYFGDKSTVRQRLTLNFTSKLFIGSIYCGEGVLFERTPSLGFQPSKYASLDKVEQFRTEGNNFLVGRRLTRGDQAKASFRYQQFTELDKWWNDFKEHVLDSKPVYFKWSQVESDSIFGLQNVNTLTKPRYVTSFHSDISLEINGYT